MQIRMVGWRVKVEIQEALH